LLGQKSAEGIVGGSFDRRSGHPELQGIPVDPGVLGPRCPGLNVDAENRTLRSILY